MRRKGFHNQLKTQVFGERQSLFGILADFPEGVATEKTRRCKSPMRVGHPGQISGRHRSFEGSAYEWQAEPDWPHPRHHILSEAHERPPAQPRLRPTIGKRNAQLRQAE